MAQIPGVKNLIYEDDVNTGSAVSEGVGTKMGASINLLLEKDVFCVSWTLNGPYGIGGATQTFVDGHRTLFCDCTLVACSMWNDIAGASGTLELDVIRYPSGGGSGTVFTTTPKIPVGSGNNAGIFRDFVSGTNPWTASGATYPVSGISNFTAYDRLILNVQQVQTGGANAGLMLWFKLR